MPVPIVVEWRRPGFYKRTYNVRRHQLAELLASLGMVAGCDFPEYVPPAQDRAQRRATGAGAEEEPAELQARAPLLDDGAECAWREGSAARRSRRTRACAENVPDLEFCSI